jgi:hypothetical protein
MYTLNLTWVPIACADSYSIFVTDSYTSGFSQQPNVTGVVTANFSDGGAGAFTQRYYRVAAVRGGANMTGNETVGKFEDSLLQDFNLKSVPLNLTSPYLGDDASVGDPLPVIPRDCIVSVYRFNSASDIDRVDRVTGGWDPATGDESFTRLDPGRGYWYEVNATSCKIIYVGAVPEDNLTLSMAQGYYVAGWYSVRNKTLGQDTVINPLVVSPANSIRASYRYNPLTDRFEISSHYPGYGWWPSAANRGFTTIEAARGYYFDNNPAAIWVHAP